VDGSAATQIPDGKNAATKQRKTFGNVIDRSCITVSLI
jgi:hypothetical protein